MENKAKKIKEYLKEILEMSEEMLPEPIFPDSLEIKENE